MVRRLVVAGWVMAACGGAAAGCGGSGEPARTGTVPRETTDRPARLPKRWKRLVDGHAGFSVGLPPGWRARATRGATLVRSGDHLLAVSITADRGSDGRRLAPREYARRIAEALPGYRGLRAHRVLGVRRAHYPAGAATASGTFTRTRVRQVIRVVALQRPRRVTYVLAFFRATRSPGALYAPAIAGMVRTFRSRAPSG